MSEEGGAASTSTTVTDMGRQVLGSYARGLSAPGRDQNARFQGFGGIGGASVALNHLGSNHEHFEWLSRAAQTSSLLGDITANPVDQLQPLGNKAQRLTHTLLVYGPRCQQVSGLYANRGQSGFIHQIERLKKLLAQVYPPDTQHGGVAENVASMQKEEQVAYDRIVGTQPGRM